MGVMHALWTAILYKPLINALALLIQVMPWGDVGMAIILLTLLVKVILLPLSQRQMRNQAAMTMLAPEIEKIKKSGGSKEEQARLNFELYKKHKVNPFSGCLVMIPTIFVLIALYRVFYQGLNFDAGSLYSFVKAPEHINTMFLGILDISKKSLLLAIIAGISQYFQFSLVPKPTPTGDSNSFQDSFAKSFQAQTKYVMPLFMGFIAYTISGVVALYLITSNIFSIGQQLYVNKTERKTLALEAEQIK